MRLLNTSTLKLNEFIGSKIPPYAILSHRWEEEEITFQDLDDEKCRQKKGWTKVTGCCERAALDGWEWVWIDTCCIDKKSSSKLSEAINSMFNWYKDSHVCYAYLSDVPTADDDPYAEDSSFRQSKWFTRGWTLQELIAPKHVEFFDQCWVEIGTKASFRDLIESITGISHFASLYNASVAQKMSWASKRETTRVEDEAYCLMGLFDVNMPLLYGEGKKAFFRLQLEILNNKDDDTIFAWEQDQVGHLEVQYRQGLLADSPRNFQKSGSVVRKIIDSQRDAPTMTSKGLRMQLSLDKLHANSYSEYLAPINCIDKTKKLEDGFSALRLHQAGDEWFRVGQLKSFPGSVAGFAKFKLKERQIVYFPQYFDHPIPVYKRGDPKILIQYQSLLKNGYEIVALEEPYFDKCPNPGMLCGLQAHLFKDSGSLSLYIKNAHSSTGLILKLTIDGQDTLVVDFIERSGLLNSGRLNIDSPLHKSTDRLSHQLDDSTSCNVSVKPGTFMGEPHTIINLDFDPSGKLRWPPRTK